MGKLGEGYGSEYHLLRYLGSHRERFSNLIASAIGADTVKWLAPPSDQKEWKGLAFLSNDCLASRDWKHYWPTQGNPPNWDAIGESTTQGNKNWLLVEAKAHLGELNSDCAAREEGGLPTIHAALDATKRALGAPPESDWLRGYYQYANRLSVLEFLTQRDVPAHLLFIYFVGDRRPDKNSCPASEEAWQPALLAQTRHLGLERGHMLADRVHQVFVPVGEL